jgi:hypothetical protein
LRRPSAKAKVSSQRRGSSSVHHNAIFPRFYGAGSQQMGMLRSRTEDYDDSDMMDIRRTGSGGLLFGDMLGIRRTGSGAGLLLKNKSSEQRQKVSQARAAELSDLYELSEQKDTELNRNAIIKHKVTCAPSMGGHLMTAKHAANNYYKIEKDHATRTKGKDPLLMAHEIKERERQATMARRKADIKKRNRGPTTPIAATSSFEDAPNRVGSSPKGVSSYDDDDLLPDTVGFEIVGGAGNGGFAMVPTVAKPLPNRPAKKTRYRAANGVYYDVPNLC